MGIHRVELLSFTMAFKQISSKIIIGVFRAHAQTEKLIF